MISFRTAVILETGMQSGISIASFPVQLVINSLNMEGTRSFLLKIILSALCVSAKLSDYTTICSVKDVAFEKCVIDAGQKFFLQMEKGIPEYDIKPVDPMAVPHLGIKRTDIGMSLVLSNSTHRGISKATIQSAKIDPKKQVFEFRLTLPSYSISGRYDVNGKVMLLPINGKGDSNITLYDLDVIWLLKGNLKEKSGVKYMDLKDFEVKIQPKNMKVHFNNLFNGNQLLGNTMNDLLNQHWKEIYRQIKPELEKSYAELLFNFATKIFSKTPYNEIFSDL